MSGMLIGSVVARREISVRWNLLRATGSDSDAFRIARLGQARNERIERRQSEAPERERDKEPDHGRGKVRVFEKRLGGRQNR